MMVKWPFLIYSFVSSDLSARYNQHTHKATTDILFDQELATLKVIQIEKIYLLKQELGDRKVMLTSEM